MKVVLFSIALIIAYNYILLIIISIRGWLQKEQKNKQEHSYPFCSIIIAARNEEQHIGTLLDSLRKQTYPEDCYEIIIADDHSNDKTADIIQYYKTIDKRITLVTVPDSCIGKKQALRQALQHSHGEYILCTDADCIVGEEWIETYITYAYCHNANMLFGNIIPTIKKTSSWIEKCIALDFIGILGVQGGLAKLGHAFSCNGANLCFTRNFYQHAYNTNEQYASGDDVFLLHTAKQKDPHKIFFIQDAKAAVETPVPNSIHAFFNQRLRWASKASGYKDKDSIIVALIVYSTCLALCLFFIGSCLGSLIALICFILIFSAKVLIDGVFFICTAQYFHSSKFLWLAIPFQCIYFIYITIIPIFAMFVPMKWKNRTIQK